MSSAARKPPTLPAPLISQDSPQGAERPTTVAGPCSLPGVVSSLLQDHPLPWGCLHLSVAAFLEARESGPGGQQGEGCAGFHERYIWRKRPECLCLKFS